ncbi:hypothetical protein Tco_1470826 [Tanacetum coccineum]
MAVLCCFFQPAVFEEDHEALTEKPKVLLDSSFLVQVNTVGEEQFSEDLHEILPGSELITTDCILDRVEPELQLEQQMKRVTCLGKEHVDETECVKSITGRVNADNYILGTQQNPNPYGEVARLAVVSYNPENHLGYLEPSDQQVSFAEQDHDMKLNQVELEKAYLKKKVKRAKRKLRKNIRF